MTAVSGRRIFRADLGVVPLDQQLHYVLVPVHCRPRQRRPTILVFRVGHDLVPFDLVHDNFKSKALYVKRHSICLSGGVPSADSGTVGVAAENLFSSFIARQVMNLITWVEHQPPDWQIIM
jgi:hypothetical protein